MPVAAQARLAVRGNFCGERSSGVRRDDTRGARVHAVATGKIDQGIIKAGTDVEIVGIRPTVKTTVTGVEMFKKSLDQGMAGDNVGLLLR